MTFPGRGGAGVAGRLAARALLVWAPPSCIDSNLTFSVPVRCHPWSAHLPLARPAAGVGTHALRRSHAPAPRDHLFRPQSPRAVPHRRRPLFRFLVCPACTPLRAAHCPACIEGVDGRAHALALCLPRLPSRVQHSNRHQAGSNQLVLLISPQSRQHACGTSAKLPQEPRQLLGSHQPQLLHLPLSVLLPQHGRQLPHRLADVATDGTR